MAFYTRITLAQPIQFHSKCWEIAAVQDTFLFRHADFYDVLRAFNLVDTIRPDPFLRMRVGRRGYYSYFRDRNAHAAAHMVRPRGAALPQRWRGGAFVARIVPVPRDCDAPASAPRMQCGRVALPSQQSGGVEGHAACRSRAIGTHRAWLTRSARRCPPPAVAGGGG